MPYVKRDTNGKISAISQRAEAEYPEYIPATAAEVTEFLTGDEDLGANSDLSKTLLAESDKDVARITEDLINLLISKNLILFTELPEAVQQKLLSREKLRSNVQGIVTDFLDDSESI